MVDGAAIGGKVGGGGGATGGVIGFVSGSQMNSNLPQYPLTVAPTLRLSAPICLAISNTLSDQGMVIVRVRL